MVLPLIVAGVVSPRLRRAVSPKTGRAAVASREEPAKDDQWIADDFVIVSTRRTRRAVRRAGSGKEETVPESKIPPHRRERQ